MNTLLPEVLVPPSDIFNFATMDPRANIACAALALAANVALFAYWLYKIVAYRGSSELSVGDRVLVGGCG